MNGIFLDLSLDLRYSACFIMEFLLASDVFTMLRLFVDAAATDGIIEVVKIKPGA